MKKFTRLWQVVMIVMLSSSMVFAQVETKSAKQKVKQTNSKYTTSATKTNNIPQDMKIVLEELSGNEQISQEVKEMISEGDYEAVLDLQNESPTSETDAGVAVYHQNEQTSGTSSYEENVKVPKTNVLKATFPGGPTEDLFCPTTPGTPIFAEDCNGYSSAGTADIDAGYRIYQPYTGNYTITEIHFWYIHAYFDGAAWSGCTEEPVDVEIGFWNNGAGGPGTNIVSYTENVTGTNTGELFAGAYPIFEYQFTLPASQTITDGWVSLMGNPGGDPNCWFMWVNSDPNSGPLNAQQEDITAGTFSDMGYPASLCIYGTNNMVNNVGVSAVTSPLSGTGLTANEVVTINLFNTGSGDQLTGFPVNYTFGGNTYTENYPGPLLSGGTDTYTFATTLDASVVGNYTLTACTVLPGDELSADDCMPYAFAHFPPYDCDWYIVGFDDYGDTWNGGYIDIYLDGVFHHTWDGPLTYGPDTLWFGIYDPCTIDIVYTAGGWGYENSYYVYDNNDNEIGNDGLGGVEPVGLTGLAGACTVITCPAPTAQTATNITVTSADLGWTEAGTAIQWDIQVVPTGDPIGVTGTVVNTNPYTWTGLAPGTTYDWYVQAECSAFDQSTWTGPHTFTTAVVIPDLLYQIDADAITLDPRNLG
ncbi:MAG: fibronectin type III domain-containing protein, partial [Bacteroidales bacterium]|nr:fibronectin type III domain-containing protein [Bacteroidales bacterium]